MAIEGSLAVLPSGVTVTRRAPGAWGSDDWAVAPIGATSSVKAMIRKAVTVIYRFLAGSSSGIKYTIFPKRGRCERHHGRAGTPIHLHSKVDLTPKRKLW